MLRDKRVPIYEMLQNFPSAKKKLIALANVCYMPCIGKERQI